MLTNPAIPIQGDYVGGACDPALRIPYVVRASETEGEKAAPTTGAAAAPDEGDDGGPGFFGSLLQAINPLQHLPVVSSLYREATGETIGAIPRLIGGALFGGIFGLVGAAMNTVLESETGRDLGGHALAFLKGHEGGAVQRASFGDPEAAQIATVANSQTVLLAATAYRGTATASAAFVDIRG